MSRSGEYYSKCYDGVTCFSEQNISVNTCSSKYGRTMNETTADGSRMGQDGSNIE